MRRALLRDEVGSLERGPNGRWVKPWVTSGAEQCRAVQVVLSSAEWSGQERPSCAELCRVVRSQYPSHNPLVGGSIPPGPIPSTGAAAQSERRALSTVCGGRLERWVKLWVALREQDTGHRRATPLARHRCLDPVPRLPAQLASPSPSVDNRRVLPAWWPCRGMTWRLAAHFSFLEPTTLIDCDLPQATSSSWYTLRQAGLPSKNLLLATAHDHLELSQKAKEHAATSGYLIIDGRAAN